MNFLIRIICYIWLFSLIKPFTWDEPYKHVIMFFCLVIISLTFNKEKYDIWLENKEDKDF